MSPQVLAAADGPLVWIDCEMTGLDHEKDVIIEIAVIITDGDLVPIDEGINYVIKTDESLLDGMDEWCTRTHGVSGLTQACLDSPFTYGQVEEEVLRYVTKRIPDRRVGVLAGSSVHADARFLSRGMPRLMSHLHYRIVDVSSVKELARRWYPADVMRAELVKNRGPQSAHRALDDIKASIDELKNYRKTVFLSKWEYVERASGQIRASSDVVQPLTYIQKGLRLVESLIYDPGMFWKFVSLWLAGETVLGLLIIRFVSYTNIDYLAYTQQAALFLSPNNERQYSKLVGDTGPLVYPALHLYIYSALHKLFPQASLVDVGGHVPGKGGSIDMEHGLASSSARGFLEGLVPLQLIWLGVYIGTLFLTALIAKKATDASGRPTQVYPRAGPITRRVILSWLLKGPTPLPFLLAAISTSMRLHSIYYLRLFNDPLAMIILYASVWLFMGHHWKAGSIIYSLALGIKMNILLFLPGLLVLLFQYQGILNGALCLGLILAVQIALAAPFLTSPALARDYFASAFDLSRSFLFKWSVNWNFVGESIFSSSEFKYGLLICHVSVLVAFAWAKWNNHVEGGTLEVLRRGLTGSWWNAPVMQTRESVYRIPLILCTSNLIGISFARSLHYQFFSWYAHQLPLLLWSTQEAALLNLVTWQSVSGVWSVFPPNKMSWVMFVAHMYTLALVWFAEFRTSNRAGEKLSSKSE